MQLFPVRFVFEATRLRASSAVSASSAEHAAHKALAGIADAQCAVREAFDFDIEVGGERLIGEEIDVLLLTTGKLSVAGIAVRLHLSIERVVEVLLRLERRHFIVFELH